MIRMFNYLASQYTAFFPNNTNNTKDTEAHDTPLENALEDGVLDKLFAQTEPPIFDAKKLREYDDYKEAKHAKGSLLMGRSKDLKRYINDDSYTFRVLHPERRGDTWTCERNAAFWAGGIESGATFKLVTSLSEIIHRAENDDSLEKMKGYFGGTVREILWLKDNGYTFEPDPFLPAVTYAKPPSHPVGQVRLRKDYGYVTDEDATAQIKKLHAILQEIKSARLKNQTFFGYGRGKPITTNDGPRTMPTISN